MRKYIITIEIEKEDKNKSSVLEYTKNLVKFITGYWWYESSMKLTSRVEVKQKQDKKP